MANRKIYCEVIEGVVYDDRCLFKLSKVIDGNKACEGCILRELEKSKEGKGYSKKRLREREKEEQGRSGTSRRTLNNRIVSAFS